MAFSVLMSVYEKEKPEYLEKALESVVNQTLLPNEIILIEDGPIGKKLKCVIDAYCNRYSYIHTYQFIDNVQLGRALAKGVELCKNELIARMDTDDIAVPERFALQYNYMKNHPEIMVCGGWIEEFDDSHTYSKIKKMPESDFEIRKYAKYRNPINHMTVMFRKSVILKAGNYKHFPFLEDYYLWCKVLAMDVEFYNLPEILVYMRTNDEMYGRRGGIAYFKQYKKLRMEQKKIGLLNKREYLLALMLTAVITLQPQFVRKITYRKALRK